MVNEEDQQQQPVQTGDRDSDLWSSSMQPKDLQQIKGTVQTFFYFKNEFLLFADMLVCTVSTCMELSGDV